MKKSYVIFVFSFFHFFYAQGQNIGDYRSKSGGSGNWNDYNAWETFNGTLWVSAMSGQIPSTTSAVEIKAGDNMVVNGTPLVSGNLVVNGSLVYNSISTSKLTVSGSVTVGHAGIFTSPTSGSVLNHSLIIGGTFYNNSFGGNLLVDGVFNMNVCPTSGVAVTFSGTPNNSISGIGTIIFYTLSIDKGSTGFNSILEVVNSTIITILDASATIPKSLTIYDGTFKLSSASTLKPYYGSPIVNSSSGRIWLNNKNAEIKSVGAGTSTSSDNTMQLGGTLQIDAGIFSFGAGNSFFNCQGDVIMNGPNSSLNIYGYFGSGIGSTYMMTDGNINIYPQLGQKSVPASNSIFQFSGKTLNFNGGKLTIFDPNPNPGTDLAIDIQSGTCNFNGSTILFGNGISDLDGTNNGFMIKTGENFLGDVIVNNSIHSTKSTRCVKLFANSGIAGNLLINSGKANQFLLNGNSLNSKGNIINNGNFDFDSTSSSGLIFSGSNQQSFGGSGLFSTNVNNLTINNTCGIHPSVDIQIPLSVSNGLTLANGSPGSSNGSIFTLGKSSVSTTFRIDRSGGFLDLMPTYALTDVSKLYVTYNSTTNQKKIITGYEIPASHPIKVFTINNSGGVILDKPVSCDSLVLKAGNITTSSENSLTVTGPLFNSVVGGGETSYINGPLTRTIPNNCNASNYKFPVGKTAFRLFEFQSLKTSGFGLCTFTVEAFDSVSSSIIAGSGMSEINTDKYWKFTADLGNVIISPLTILRFTDTALVITNRISQSNTVSGTFNSVGGVVNGTTISSVNPVDFSSVSSGVFFRIGIASVMSAGRYAIGPKSSYDGYTGTYNKLSDAITSITSVPINGNLIFEFQPDYKPSIESYPINFNSNILNNATSTITFRPAGTVNSVINFSTVGTVINNSGADYIHFDGRNGGTDTNQYLAFTNSDATQSTVTLSNDALYNQFLYCILKGNTNAAETGIMTLTGSVSGNNNFTIDHCSFNGNSSANNCLYTKGSADNGTITNTDFFDFRNGAGICLSAGSNNVIVDNNNFYQSVPYAGISGTTSGIIISGGNNVRISNNNIGGNKTGLIGIWTVTNATPAPYNFIGINATSLTSSKIYTNRIQNFDWKSTVSTWSGINVSGNVSVGTDGTNIIGKSTDNDNIKITYYQAGSSHVNGLLADGAAIIENNTIGSITTLLSGVTSTGVCFTGIYSSGTGPINNNIIGSPTVARSINTSSQTTTLNSNNVYGIYSLGSSVSISNNIIANLYNGSLVASGVTRGIFIANSTSTVAINSNDIHSITTTQPVTDIGNSASLDGINIQASNTSSIAITGNLIYDLENLSANTISLNGIFYKSSRGTNNIIDKNYIHSFKTVSNSAIQNGINFMDGAANIQNNAIRLGIDKDGNSVSGSVQINGILKSSVYAANFYFNTVYIGGTNVTVGDVNTYAFNFSVKSNALEELKNNIFINMRSNTNSSKLNYAVSIPSITNLWSSDYNYYNVSVLNGKFCSEGGTDLLTLNALQNSNPGSDLNSGFGDPLLSNPSDGISTLDLHPLNISTVVGFGTPISSVNCDISGTLRNLIAPTLGAYEMDCINPTSGGSITGDQLIVNSIPEIISTISPASNYSGKLEYKWQYEISPFTCWIDIPNGNTLSYQPGVINKTTQFKRLARSTCSYVWAGSVESNVVTISVPQTKWKGSVSSDWNNPENWTLNKLPDADDDLVFDNNPLNDCILDQNRSVNNITNNQPVRLNINGKILTIKGNIQFTNGAQIESSSPNSTIEFSGLSVQSIPSGVFINDMVYNLTIDNATGVSQDSDFTVNHLLTINEGAQFIIPTGKLLNVAGTINNNAGESGLILKASPSGNVPNGSLIFHNNGSSGSYVPATIEMYTKASKINDNYKWQFFGIPLKSVQAFPTFNGSYIREMHENVTGTNGHWVQLQNESVLTSFTGYEITQETCKMLLFNGNLENADYGPVTLSYTSDATYEGQHLIGNPYLASIKIKNEEIPANSLTFGEGMEKTVYLYNTGSKDDWSKNGLNGEGNNDDAGQYLAVPQENAGIDLLPRSIPSMQAFLVMVKTPGPTATISIPYNTTGTMEKNSGLQRASANEKIYTRIEVTGTGSVDRMWIFTDPACNRGFDNGWDGYKMIGYSTSPQIYAIETDGNYQVNSVDDINNTNIGFKAGLDTVYTLTFTHHNKDARYRYIYLMDLCKNKTVDISDSGSQYSFHSNSSDTIVNRFKIIASNDGIDISTITESPKTGQHSISVFNTDKIILVNNKSNLNGNIYLYELTGKIVKTMPFKANCISTLPVKLPSGYYVCTAVTSNEEIIIKLILKDTR